MAIRNSATCGHCGEHRRIDGRDPDGVAWCARCRQHDRRAAIDAGRRQRILAAVDAADPALDLEMIHDVLEATVQSRRSLGLLADHLDDPDVFAVGPTSTLPILDRFTIALEAAGAQRITSIHPVCDRCGRRRRWHARTDSGGECSTCWARTHREPCSVCGRARNVDHRDEHGRPVCEPCVQQQRRRQRLDELATEIAAAVEQAVPSIDATMMIAVLDRVAPKVPTRAVIARQLEREPPLSTAVHRVPLVARLLAELRAAGASLPAARCEDCAGPAEPLVVYRDVVRCHGCAKRCPDCDGNSKEPLKARCGRCDRQPRGTCTECGRVDRPVNDGGRCRACQDRAERRCIACCQQVPRTWHDGRWLCQRCALAVDLDGLLGPVERLSAELVSLRAAILAADNPTQVRKWLRTSTAGRVLARLATGEIAVTHDALDVHGGGDRSVGHLRALLVAAGALPAEDRSINRLEAFAAGLLDDVTDAGDRKVMRAWLRWQVLPRLRTRTEAGLSMAHSANNARRALRQVTAFIHSLGTHGRTLRECTQANVDDWFAGTGASRWLTRPFLVWAAARGHLPADVRIPACPPQGLRPALDGEQRWGIARQLVTDDSIDLADRVAGALVVLYGQPLARIAALRTGDIHRSPDGTTLVDLAGNPVPIHEPFATLIGQLPQRRSNGVSDQLDGNWLFPGRHAGRHTGPVVLGERLRAIGIEPRRMRNSARAQLAAEIPPALLGELIGVNANTATRWAALTAGNWTAFAADLAHG